jgi:MFS family permease
VTKLVATLRLTTYLFGLGIEELFLAPLGEMYERQPNCLITYSMFLLLMVPTALSQTFVGILLPRFFAGIFASAALTNASRTVSDITRPRYLALAFGIYSIGPINGPVLGPIIENFVVQYLGWRWTVWIAMILAGVGLGDVRACYLEDPRSQKTERYRRRKVVDTT